MAQKFPSDEDRMIAREIARATEFSAYYRNGPRDKTVIRGIATYEEAKAKVAEIVAAQSRFGRGGLVYAITPIGSFPCDDKLIALSREITNA